jgi:hypothetical protein
LYRAVEDVEAGRVAVVVTRLYEDLAERRTLVVAGAGAAEVEPPPALVPGALVEPLPASDGALG